MDTTGDKTKLTKLGDTARECPFCGSNLIYLVENETKGGGKYYGVRCVDCHTSMENCFFRHPWDAINAWNGGDEGRYCDRRHEDEQKRRRTGTSS